MKTATQFLLTFAPFIYRAKPILGGRIISYSSWQKTPISKLEEYLGRVEYLI